MSILFSGSNQGRWVANGQNLFIPLPSGCDWIEVRNESIGFGTEPSADSGVKFYWQSGDTTGRGSVEYFAATGGNFPALNFAQIAAGAGFYFINTTNSTPGPLNNGSTGITAISTATPPRVTVGSTANMHTGQTVQLYNVAGAPQLNGLQFTITVIDSTHFDLAYAFPLTVAGTTGSFRVIPYEPIYTLNPAAPANINQTPLLLQDPYWYPTLRYITNISQATQAIITLSVTHTYTIGQSVTLHVPTVTSTAYGMPQLDQLQDVVIVNINQADANGYTNTITVNVDTTGFGPFAFPLAASGNNFSPATVVPIGENTAQALNSGQNILADSTINQSGFGLLLVAGALSPAGANTNVITYVAGKSFNGM
jgi:hypothetical protein